MRSILITLVCLFYVTVNVSVTHAMGGVQVRGCCNSTGMIATPSNVSNAATKASNKVSDTFKDIGKELSFGQDKIMETINNNYEAQNMLLSDLFKGLGNADQKMEAMKTYGKKSEAFMGCESNELGIQIKEGKKAEKQLSSNLGDDFNKHSTEATSSRYAYNRLLDQIENEELATSGEALFPSSGTMTTEELKQAKEMSKTLLDPFPTPNISDDLADTNKGKDFRTLLALKQTKMAVPSQVMADTIASHSPTIQLGSWANEIPGIDEDSVSEDKISPMGFIDAMVDLRFANPEWYNGNDGIHSKTETGLLRELAVMNSVRMEMERRQTKSMQQIAAMLAEQTAAETSQDLDDSLQHLRTEAVESKID